MIVFRVKGGGPRRPVARIGDDHQCPKRNDDGSAHKGGPVVTGSPTMKANGRPVARVGDKVHCDGSTDTIIKGIDNLLVDGKPIAVQGSKCAHGGVIVEGSPNVFVEEYTDAHKAEHFARMRAMGIDVDEHWIQGQYLDGDGNGVYGMPYRIIHEDGTEANGTLDDEGKTEKMQYLSQGTATIYFGDRPGLEEELQDERKQLKKYLDNILAKTRAYAQAHPDKIADENEYEQLYTENLAFARGLGMGAVKLVKGTASGVAHLFKIAAMDIRESVDTIDGDNQDYNKVAKAETAQGRAIVTNIEKGKHLLELVYEDQPTRDMLEKFAENYYLSETPMMIAKEAGEAAGGLIPGILISLMTGSPELVPAEVASEAGADIAGVANVANRMARTLKELKETKDIEQAEVDRNHLLRQRPSGVDEGAAYHADTDNLPNPGYQPDNDLAHPAGVAYSLSKEDAENFSGQPIPKVLPPGTKIYRIVEADESGDVYVNGRYWSYDLPENLPSWRSQFAVKGLWNKDGYYVEYVVGQDGLPVWEGATASQSYYTEGYDGWIQAGGAKQVFVPNADDVIPESLERIPTTWEQNNG